MASASVKELVVARSSRGPAVAGGAASASPPEGGGITTPTAVLAVLRRGGCGADEGEPAVEVEVEW